MKKSVTKNKARKYFLAMLLAMVIIGVIGVSLHILFHYPPFQQYLIHKLAQTSSYQIQSGAIGIEYQEGLMVVFDDVIARSKRSTHAIKAGRLELGFDYKALLRGRLIPSRISIGDAVIKYTPTPKPAGTSALAKDLDVAALIEPLFSPSSIIAIDNAAVEISGSNYGFTHLFGHFGLHESVASQREVQLKGLFTHFDEAMPFQMYGIVRHPSTYGDRTLIDADINIEKIQLAHFPWLKRFRFDHGWASANVHLNGPTENGMTISGQIATHDLEFSVNRNGRVKNYAISQGTADFHGFVGLTNSRIETLTVRTPQAEVGLKLQLDWQNPSNLFMDLIIQSQPVNLPAIKTIFPTPLVPQWIKVRLFPIFSDGRAQLDRLRLVGTIDALKQIKFRENAGVFELRLTLADMKAFPKDADLTINAVSGEVVIKKGQLLINNVTGRFENSALKQGRMVWPDLYDKTRRYTLGIRGEFGLEDLKRQGTNSILPAVIQRQIDLINEVSGDLKADIELAFTGKRQLPTLTGEMELKNSRISHTLFIEPLDGVDGRFIFEKPGTIRSSGKGRWGATDFEFTGTIGRFWNRSGIEQHPELDLRIKADVDWSDALTVRRLTFLPANWRKPLKAIDNIHGQGRIDLYLVRKKSDTAVKMTGTLETNQATLVHPALKLPLTLRNGRIEFKATGQRQFSAEGTWGRSIFNAVGAFESEKRSMQVEISTQANVSELIDRLYPQSQSVVRTDQSLNGRVQIKLDKATWFFNGEINLDNRTLIFPRVSVAPVDSGNRLTFEGAYTDDHLVLDHCIFTNLTSQLTLKGSISPKPGKVVRIDIAAAPLDLAGLGFRVKADKHGSSRWLRGELKGRITAEVPISDRLNPQINGELSLSDGLIEGMATTSNFRADLRFQNRHVDIIHVTIPFGEHQAELQGRLTGWDRWRGNLNLEIDCIDLPKLMDRLRADSSGKAKGTTGQEAILAVLTGAELKVGLRADQVIWETIDMGNFDGELQYQNDRLQIKKAVFTAPNGVIKLTGSVSPKPRRELSLLVYSKLEQTPLNTILDGLNLPTKRINGTLTLEGGIFLQGRNQEEILQHLAGKLNLKITKGEFQKSNVIIKILDFLSIQNIFLRRPPDILKDRFYFESIEGHVTVAKGKLTTDRLFMQSPVFNAAVKGQFHLLRNQINFLIGVQPLNTIDRIISKIPIIGRILTGKKKTILVYYFKVRGQPEDVLVKHIPFRNLDEAIVGYFKRIFLTPTRLWTKIADTLEEIGKDLRSGGRIP